MSLSCYLFYILNHPEQAFLLTYIIYILEHLFLHTLFILYIYYYININFFHFKLIYYLFYKTTFAAPGGNGRLVGYSNVTKQQIVIPTDGKAGNRDKAAILLAAQDTNDPLALEKALKTEVPFDSAQLRKHGK